MNPVKFEGANDVLSGPAGTTEDEVGSMIMHRGYDPTWNNFPVITSCWEPSAEEKEEFLRTGKIFLRIWGHTHPPISLSVYNPVEHGWVMNGTALQPNHPLLQSETPIG